MNKLLVVIIMFISLNLHAGELMICKIEATAYGNNGKINHCVISPNGKTITDKNLFSLIKSGWKISGITAGEWRSSKYDNSYSAYYDTIYLTKN